MAENDILILGIGVSVHKTDGVLRFEHFCKAFDLPYKIVGEGKVWRGGDMFAGAGGGQKINEIIEVLKPMDNKLIIMCDTFDLFPIAGKEEIIEKFKKLTKPSQILFTSEVFCWPDSSLANRHPPTLIPDANGLSVVNKYRFLNSGGIMGYRDDIYNLIMDASTDSIVLRDNDDDQLFFTRKYLKMLEEPSNKGSIVLDTQCEVFQAVNGCSDDLVIHRNRIYNKYTNSYPIFIHGNGPAKSHLNSYENYIEPLLLNYYKTDDNHTTKKIFIAVYLDSSKPDHKTFLYHVSRIHYPNKVVYVYDSSDNLNGQAMSDVDIYKPNVNEYVFEDFVKTDCDYYFLLEDKCLITKTDILHDLVTYIGKPSFCRVIAPMLTGKSNKLSSNFWGALDNSGFYKRSHDYIDIANYNKRGSWNVPYVTGAILLDRSIITNWNLLHHNKFTDYHKDMSLCYNLRRETLFIYVVNNHHYGYII